MKKKILSFVLALCLIIPCAMVFTACGKDEEPKAPTTLYVSTEAELVSAVTKIADGGKIVLNADITFSSSLEVSNKFTLDLNGKTINNTEDLYNLSTKVWSLISVREGGDLTVVGDGVMEAKENDCYVFDVRGGELTIEDGSFNGNISVVYVVEGELVVAGGSFKIQQLSEPKNGSDERFTLNCEDNGYRDGVAKISVTGGTFRNYNPSNNLSEGANTDVLADGLTVETETEGGYTWYTVIADAQ